MNMTRLILTTSDSGAGGLRQTGLADIVVPLGFRFVWGPLPSDAELAAALAPHPAPHDQTFDRWLRNVYWKHFREVSDDDIGLLDLCERCESIELWVDPDPNAQLTLIWLLDSLRHQKIASKLTLRQANVVIGNHFPEELAEWQLPSIAILNDHLDTAGAAWQAYRAPTPRDWFNLLSTDLSVLPQLPRAAGELLEELPMLETGLGATKRNCWKSYLPGTCTRSRSSPAT